MCHYVAWLGDDPLEGNATGERPGRIYLPVFHLSTDTVSFLSRAVQGFTGLLLSGTQWNTTLNYREERKPVAHQKKRYVKTILLFLQSFPPALQVSSKGRRTLQAFQFIWMDTNRLFRHFDTSKFCRHILWSIRHSLAFNLVSPRGLLSCYFMRKSYGLFFLSPCTFSPFKARDFFFLFFFLPGRRTSQHLNVRKLTNSKGETCSGCPLIVCPISQISQKLNKWPFSCDCTEVCKSLWKRKSSTCIFIRAGLPYTAL